MSPTPEIDPDPQSRAQTWNETTCRHVSRHAHIHAPTLAPPPHLAQSVENDGVQQQQQQDEEESPKATTDVGKLEGSKSGSGTCVYMHACC